MSAGERAGLRAWYAPPMRRLLLAALLSACGAPALAACGAPATPAATPTAQATPPAAPTKAAEPAPAKAATDASKRAPEPPLTQEELDLIAADPATLTPEKRRDRAFALRRKIMQNPDSPAARQLEEIRQGVESGAIKPELPRKSEGLVLSAPDVPPKSSTGTTPAPTPTPAPTKAP